MPEHKKQRKYSSTPENGEGLSMGTALNQPFYCTEQMWKEIALGKKRLFNENISPLDNPCVRPEIAASWLRAKQHGLDPKAEAAAPILTEEQFEYVKEENHELIEIVLPLIRIFEKMATLSEYTLALSDKNCVTLLYEGNFRASYASKFYGTDGRRIIASERYRGTMAHILAHKFHKPIQLVGPENFYDIYKNNISSAAPLFDKDGSLLGILTLILDRRDEMIWTDETHKLQAAALGWVSSLGIAIENQYHLSQKNTELTATNHALDTILSYVDEGILTIDSGGIIGHINRRGRQILGIEENVSPEKPLSDYLCSEYLINEMIKPGNNLDYMEGIIETPQGRNSYLFSTRPILQDGKKGSIGSVIRISAAKNLQKYVTSQGSSYAPYTFNSIIGNSESIISTKRTALLFAQTQENVLLAGRSGTGKELFAQSIHNASRSDGPFIALNCAALPRTLVESELFGYEGGSFTGAERRGRIGKIEMAQGGTLFLDEIGDMPIDLQAVFLRVLENKTFTRIGGNKLQHVDFRLIAATNQDLLSLVEKNLFREDLYYRLSTLVLPIPPLSERSEDIILLAEYFIEQCCERMKRELAVFTPETKRLFMSYNWPGNVRQLEKAIIHAFCICQNNTITPDDLPDTITNNKFLKNELPAPPAISVQETKRMQIIQALTQANFNVTEAAALLNIGRSTLYKYIHDYNIMIRKLKNPNGGGNSNN